MTNTSATISHIDQSAPVSVIIAASDVPGLAETIMGYRDALDALGRKYEVICVTDGAESDTVFALKAAEEKWPELDVLPQRPWNGDDVALATAVRRANHALVLTLSGRLARRQAIAEASAFGSRQHFIPVVAAERGYRVAEVEVAPAVASAKNARYVFKPLGHMRALLDGMSLFVVLKFMRRPMRFFGSIGLPIFLFGTIATLVLVAMRIFGDAALADRPALIAFVLMIVLGAQIIAIGLVGEIMIFANAQKIKQYTVRNLIRDGKAKQMHGAAAKGEDSSKTTGTGTS